MYKIQPKTLIIGKTTEYLPICHSTNDYCQEIIANPKIESGHVVYTGYQTAGRGQRGNHWEAAKNQNIMFSMVLKPQFLRANDQFYLNIAVALGVFEALKPILSGNLAVKWPNDIYFDNFKIGGILIENSIQGMYLANSIIGIGLNVNQLHFENDKASSISKILNQQQDLAFLHEKIIENIEKYYFILENNEIDFLKSEYLKILFRIYETHNFKKNGQVFSGEIIGIDPLGRLEIKTEFGIEVFDFKGVEFLI